MYTANLVFADNKTMQFNFEDFTLSTNLNDPKVSIVALISGLLPFNDMIYLVQNSILVFQVLYNEDVIYAADETLRIFNVNSNYSNADHHFITALTIGVDE